MMESIEKLRESLKDCTSKAGIEPNQFDTYWITARACDMLIDEIEREIAVKYMELPLDADGVPIKLGDRIKCTDTPTSRTFIVLAIGKTKGGNPVFHGYEEKGDHLERHRIGPNTRHAKPRTIEDVLQCAGVSVASIEDVAAEIRELMGVGDAE